MIQSITHSQCENKIIHNGFVSFPPEREKNIYPPPGTIFEKPHSLSNQSSSTLPAPLRNTEQKRVNPLLHPTSPLEGITRTLKQRSK